MSAPAIAAAQLDLLQQAMWVPDDVRDLDGWLVRRSRGVTKRANSVLPLGEPPQLDVAVALVEALYRQQGITPCFQLTPAALPTGLDDRLAAQGWEVRDPSLVMVGELAHVAANVGAPRRPVTCLGAPDAAHAARAYGTGDKAAVMTEIGLRTPSVYASVRDADGSVLAACRGALVGEWLGLFELSTTESHRRQGLASDVVAELVRRAAGAGATGVVLQVVADNAGARAMYDRLGFSERSRYHYRVRA